MGIAWDGFIDDARLGNVGGTFEYLDTEAQAIIIRDTDDALISTYDNVELGQWLSSEFTNNLRVGHFGLAQFVPRHNYNGEIWAVGIVPTLVPAETERFPTPAVDPGFYIFRYKYWQDLTSILDSVDTSEQAEKQIKDAGIVIKNIGEEELNNTSSMFASGSRIICKVGMGDSSKMFVGTIFLDEVDWDKLDETMSLTGRNAIGYYLSEQSFDDSNSYSGTRTEIVNAILLYSGVNMSNVYVETDATAFTAVFDPTDTLLDGLNTILDIWGWKLSELPDGKIIIGSPTFHETYYTLTVHQFDKDEAFTRGLNQRSDGAYSRLALTSRISEDPGPPVVPAFTRIVYKDLSYFDSWNIGMRRTLYIRCLDEMSELDLTALATEYAKAYQFIGVNLLREVPIHPEIQCGDVIEFIDAEDNEYIQQGIVTGVKHNINVKRGVAHTLLSIDSGGTIVIDGSDVTTYTAHDVTGDTRRRELIDVIRKEVAR